MKFLDRCLKSVDWADSVVVHEAGSTSALPEKSTDWVCSLWGEECIEPLLREELLALREQDLRSTAQAYRIPIRSRVLGRWLKGSLWGPSPSLRVRREAALPPCDWCDLAGEKSRATKVMGGWLSDYSPADLSGAVDRVNTVWELWAASMFAAGKSVKAASVIAGSFGVFARILRANGFTSGGLASVTLGILAAYGAILGAVKVRERSAAG